jgi:hypothetical protein
VRVVDRALLALLVGYVAIVALDVLLDRDLDLLHPATFGSSPASVANGELERLITSGVVVNGPVAGLQLAVLVGVTAAVLTREGVRVWWGAAAAGHLGSALIAYAFIALALAVGATSPGRVTDQADFGISCVLAGLLGALFAGSTLRLARRRSRDDLIVAGACFLALLALIPSSLDWYGIEHPLAFALGAAFVVYVRQKRCTGAQ